MYEDENWFGKEAEKKENKSGIDTNRYNEILINESLGSKQISGHGN